MSKGMQNLTLTRERKIALPVILRAARLSMGTAGFTPAEQRQLESALKAFD